MRISAVALIAMAMANPSTATSEVDAPASVIPWLSESLAAPVVPQEPAVSPSILPEVAVTPLGAVEASTAGLITADAAGLPSDLWAHSDANRLAELIAAMPSSHLPAVRRMLMTLLLVEAEPPIGPTETFLTTRIDALLRLGALDAAQALLERAGPTTPELFRRWFDVGLLTGTEDRACATLAAKLELSASYPARIFCLARAGRWPTAELTLETASALGQIDDGTQLRLAWFLDPDLFEGTPPPPRPDPVTPLDFRILEAVGEPVPTRDLPLAFAQSDLRHVIGWKAQLEAAERLARDGALDPNQLLGIYTVRTPSASGGVWDRVAAIQVLDITLNAGDLDGVAATLGPARQVMHEASLDAVLAKLIAPRLARLDLPSEAAEEAYELALTSDTKAAFSPPPEASRLTERTTFLSAIARGNLEDASPANDREAAIRAAFMSDELAPSDAALLDEARIGEALLSALVTLAPGLDADPNDAGRALALLRAADHETTARHIALQMLGLDFRG
ncbi:MAG: hypothetical protein AAGH83_06930 [Pseudomonadota bacterium]